MLQQQQNPFEMIDRMRLSVTDTINALAGDLKRLIQENSRLRERIAELEKPKAEKKPKAKAGK